MYYTGSPLYHGICHGEEPTVANTHYAKLIRQNGDTITATIRNSNRDDYDS